MELGDLTFENDWVKLETIRPSDQTRDFIRASGAIEAMWEWLPRLPDRGTTFDAYYDHVMRRVKSGAMLPVFVKSKIDGSFAGGASFMRINRTHRSLQIGFVWMPPHLRGSPISLATQAAMLQGAIEWRARRVFWLVDVLNTRYSHFLEEKVGAKKEGVLESYARMNDGRWSTSAVYALVGDGIPKAVKRIEANLAREFSVTD